MGEKRTVLIVDDDRNLRRLYELELAAEGYRTLVARDGREAVDVVDKEKPDVVVLDIRMPGMDGIDAMGTILRNNRGTRVLINTAYSCYQDDFVTWAADDYLIKSSDVEVLKSRIRALFAA